MTSNLHVRISILNPGDDVTPLKFRGWLRTEAASIDFETRSAAQEHKACVIRIFLPEKLRMAIGQRKLDKILQDVVDKFESIQRVELRSVDTPLTSEQMMQVQEEVKAELASLMAATADNDAPDDKPTIH